ncbi:MAG: hypothetical protein Q7U76_06195 [Nitrospirota bacterium]|nr:hypothetical protein [Nitrospirota bacterium]
MRRILPLVCLILGVYTLPALAFDPSDYRQNTYGPPNHYCDPTRALNSNGSGTLGAPWNMSQCATQPVAGDVVGVLPGISVRLPTTNSSRIPAFNPTNSGASDRRIVYVTKHAAVALASVETNPLRTELRHDGGAPSIVNGIGVGTGAPMYGANGRNYITFDGFYVDMAQAYVREDSGVIRPESARGIHFRNFVIKGATLTIASNAVIYRPHAAIDTVLSNFRTYDFINNSTGSTTPQNALFSDQYGDQNFLIEHFEIRNTQRGIFLKGTAPAGGAFNYGTIRYGIVSDVSSCYQFNDLDSVNTTTLQYSLCYNTAQSGGVVMSSETSPARNLIIDHVTVAKVDAASINTEGGIITRNNGIASNVVITNNIVDNNSGTFGHEVSLGNTLPAIMSNNAYYKNGGTETYVYNGTQYNSMSSWLAAINGRDANSQKLTSSPFMDRANNNFRINAGHALKTASSTGGELGAYGGSQTVGVDISGSTGGTADLTPPATPVGIQLLLTAP